MSVTPPPEFLKWGDLVHRLLIPTYYRIFSFTSIHAPIGDIVKVCDYMANHTALSGKFTATIPGRLYTWNNLVINESTDNPVTMNIRVFGSPTINKNTVFVRIGWWKAYVIDAAMGRVGGVLGRFTG